MHRRFLLAISLAASSLVVSALVAPEAAESRSRGQRAEPQGFFRLLDKPETKRVRKARRATRVRGRAQRSTRSRQHSRRQSNVARTTLPHQDARFNYGPRKAVTTRKTTRRHAVRHVAKPHYARTTTPYQDTRFNYGPLRAVAEPRTARRGATRQAAVTRVVPNWRDDRFTYGSRRVAARRQADRRRTTRSAIQVVRTTMPYQDSRFDYGPIKAVAEPRGARRAAARQVAVTRVVPDWRDDRFTYGSRRVASKRQADLRRTARTETQVARTTTSYDDDRFSYGPREAVTQRHARQRARNAMARAYVPTPDRDGGHDAGPQFRSIGIGASNVVAEARRWIGPNNPTSRRTLWCARFMNFVLERSGYSGTGSDMASSFARYGRRIAGPQVGAIAVMWRGRRGGHVGVVSGIDENGNPIIISGNHGNRVAEATYSRHHVYAYVMPI